MRAMGTVSLGGGGVELGGVERKRRVEEDVRRGRSRDNMTKSIDAVWLSYVKERINEKAEFCACSLLSTDRSICLHLLILPYHQSQASRLSLDKIS